MLFDPWVFKTWPAWLWITTPLKLFLYLINRLLTATGVAYNISIGCMHGVRNIPQRRG